MACGKTTVTGVPSLITIQVSNSSTSPSSISIFSLSFVDFNAALKAHPFRWWKKPGRLRAKAERPTDKLTAMPARSTSCARCTLCNPSRRTGHEGGTDTDTLEAATIPWSAMMTAEPKRWQRANFGDTVDGRNPANHLGYINPCK